MRFFSALSWCATSSLSIISTMSASQEGPTGLWDLLDMKTSVLGVVAAYAAWRVYVVVNGLRVRPATYVSRALKAYLLSFARVSVAYQEYILQSSHSLFSVQLCLCHLGISG